jgi:hypothetical protein
MADSSGTVPPSVADPRMGPLMEWLYQSLERRGYTYGCQSNASSGAIFFTDPEDKSVVYAVAFRARVEDGRAVLESKRF